MFLECQPKDYFTVLPINKLTIQSMVSVGPFVKERKGILIITLAQQAKTRTHLNTLDMQSPRSSGANNFIDVDDCASYWDWET